MPTLTRLFIKTALVYFMAALLLSVVGAAGSALSLPTVTAYLGPTSVHLFTVGWITQMIFGVAYWMFPRHSRERPRGSAVAIAATYILLNAGILLRTPAEPFHARAPGSFTGSLLIAAGALQLAAGLTFVGAIWGRVKAK
ncbi:MAG: hypothetical protein GWN99_12950 [Gemmatimonadetes bacterium]|uniref:Cytochrome C and Quinol oxidase polypeptide I n=1 Tax=Candidatus Kutchimonas denitrificans TaxID=3056748 RepID=A0AAE4ZBD8_9BACT|nr:hypothetical protein [Gemmatimonadota bacterium]NIR75786.1 hypothetical protein [Candidatus Kutchimonas denitrificans]NIS01954.1 hypothetical protein [Gemmatimonadota bacterium]NIT67758.1 hypothetical protein [Gemmatimonadota bacterium]NIU53745.1 hypothetical protein [Gemmatimonadota bacterium]